MQLKPLEASGWGGGHGVCVFYVLLVCCLLNPLEPRAHAWLALVLVRPLAKKSGFFRFFDKYTLQND